MPRIRVRTDSIMVPTGVGTQVVIARNHATDPNIVPNVRNSVPMKSSILAIEKSLKK